MRQGCREIDSKQCASENISHLESVVHYGIELAQQNKGAELLDL